MLVNLLDMAWFCAAASAGVFVLYGGYLVYVFQTSAGVAARRAVAALALHESRPPSGALPEMKGSVLIS